MSVLLGYRPKDKKRDLVAVESLVTDGLMLARELQIHLLLSTSIVKCASTLSSPEMKLPWIETTFLDAMINTTGSIALGTPNCLVGKGLSPSFCLFYPYIKGSLRETILAVFETHFFSSLCVNCRIS